MSCHRVIVDHFNYCYTAAVEAVQSDWMTCHFTFNVRYSKITHHIIESFLFGQKMIRCSPVRRWPVSIVRLLRGAAASIHFRGALFCALYGGRAGRTGRPGAPIHPSIHLHYGAILARGTTTNKKGGPFALALSLSIDKGSKAFFRPFSCRLLYIMPSPFPVKWGTERGRDANTLLVSSFLSSSSSSFL